MTAYPILLIALLLAVNPARAAFLTPWPQPASPRQAAFPALAAFALLAAAALLAAPTLAALAITPETFRIAAGAAAAITGLALLAYPGRPPAQPHPASPLYPLVWPVLVNPATLLLTVSFAADAGPLLTLLAAAPALTATALALAAPRSRPAALNAAARLTAALLVIPAVALILRGVEAV